MKLPLPIVHATPIPVYIANTQGSDVPMYVLTVAGVIASVLAAYFSWRLWRLSTLRPRLDISIWERFPTLNFDAATYHLGLTDRPMTFVPELQINNTGSRAALSGCYVSIWLPKAFTFVDASLQSTGWNAFTMKDGFNSRPGTSYWHIEQYIKEPVFVGHSSRLPSFTINSPTGEADVELLWKIWYEAGEDPKGDPGVLPVGVRLPAEYTPIFK